MKIKYYVSKDKTMVCATPSVNSKYAEGIDEEIADALIAMKRLSKSNITIDCSKIVGKAKLHPEDSYDEQTGKDIAKERLLVKYNKELAKVHRRYSAELKRLQQESERRYLMSEKKVSTAESVLSELL